jgi:predicted MPP superfamily phosphohydrolase
MRKTTAILSPPLSRRFFLQSMVVLGAGAAWSQGSDTVCRFGMVTDLHYADTAPRGSRVYRDSIVKLREAIAELNTHNLDFLIELGDFKDQDTPPDETTTQGYLNQIETVFQEFAGARYHVLGNHDMDSLSKKQFLHAVSNTGIPAERGFYSFEANHIHCIVLDANYTRGGDDYDHGNFDWTDANIPAGQWQWLEEDLSDARHPAIVFVHQRLDGEGDVFVNNAAQIRRVLESKNVRAVFQGHHHGGGLTHENGIWYYTLKAMVEGAGLSNSAFAVVDVMDNGALMVRGYAKADNAAMSPD